MRRQTQESGKAFFSGAEAWRQYGILRCDLAVKVMTLAPIMYFNS